MKKRTKKVPQQKPPLVGGSSHEIPRGVKRPVERYQGDAGSAKFPSGSAPKKHSNTK